MKLFDPTRDIVSQISPVNETIIVAGSLFSGAAGDANIKRTTHWTSGSVSGSFYQAVYSTNYSASTAVELVDISYGISISSSIYSNAATTQKDQLNRTYRLFAKSLLGSETSRFSIGSQNRDELIFLAIKRSQFKDEIKKGSVSMIVTYTGSSGGPATSPHSSASLNDNGAATTFTETNRGHTANLLSGAVTVGTIYYQAGIIVMIPDLVSSTSSIAGNEWSGSLNYEGTVVSGGLRGILDGARTRLQNLTFINQTNLHATFYFCRALNDEFNYSSNPTFTDASGRIIPTSGANNLTTRTYITKVGLLGENGEVLAVGGLSKPIKKTPNIEYSLVVRLDY